jgi:ABC-type sugar transport system substrate-binding protein
MFRRIRVTRYRVGAAVAIAGAALAVGVSTSSATTSTPKLAMIVGANNQNAFQEMADGAIVAAAKYGDKLTSLAPPSTTDDATTEVTEFQSAETSAPNGIGIMTTVPPDFGTVEAQAEKSGIPVVAVDSCPVPTSMVPTCVANNNEQVGEGIATALVNSGKIAKGEKGLVVVGDDIPQLGLLGLRIQGMIKVLKAYDPNLTFTPTQNVTPGPTTNEQAWASLVAKYPKAVLYLAPGDQDAVSFVDIEKSTGKSYLNIACDVDPVAIKGVEDGQVFGLGDPHHFMKGYIAMWILNQYARTGKLLKGWFNPGSGVITKANIATIVKRETNNQTRYAYYKSTIAAEIADPSKYVVPLSQAGMN